MAFRGKVGVHERQKDLIGLIMETGKASKNIGYICLDLLDIWLGMGRRSSF